MNAKPDLKKNVQKALKGKNIHIDYVENTNKYSKERFFNVYQAYDMLGELKLVRMYIQSKYEIDWNTLEILLQLMAWKVFTVPMFRSVPKSDKTLYSWKYFKNLGYTNLVMEANKWDKQLHSLNAKGNHIIKEFYECLSGEKPIPETSKHNPIFKVRNRNVTDNMRVKLIKEFNKLEKPSYFKHLYK